MNTVLTFIANAGYPSDSSVLFGAIFFTFMFMFFFVLAVTDIVQRRSDIRKRTVIDRGLSASPLGPEQSWETKARSLRFQSFAENSALLGRVERGQKEGEKESERTKVQRALVNAGFFGPNSALWFHAMRLSLLVGLPLIVHIVLLFSNSTIRPSSEVGFLAAIGGIGFLLPGRYLTQRAKAMRQECRDGFPDFMDLMVVCAEAGLSPLELRAGSTLSEAVENLARRTGVEEVLNLGSLLYQTEQLGTSLTEALRIYSDEMREKRLSRAEEKAHALPVKLTLPLGLFIFPVMLVVIALPIIVRIRNALFAF
jgi:tight adherence protein C